MTKDFLVNIIGLFMLVSQGILTAYAVIHW